MPADRTVTEYRVMRASGDPMFWGEDELSVVRGACQGQDEFDSKNAPHRVQRREKTVTYGEWTEVDDA